MEIDEYLLESEMADSTLANHWMNTISRIEQYLSKATVTHADMQTAQQELQHWQLYLNDHLRQRLAQQAREIKAVLTKAINFDSGAINTPLLQTILSKLEALEIYHETV